MKIAFTAIMASSLFYACYSADGAATADEVTLTPKAPIMGWSSWNNFRVNINEEIILSQADAMVETGMIDVGYSYINIDDGYFGGRDNEGNLLTHPGRFPHGMKAVANYIHAAGLKAGIYSDAGINTCACSYDKDSIGVGCGLYGHDVDDLTLMLKDWDYDFIKVDWCGGNNMGLTDYVRYKQISELVYKIKPEVVFNVCRWGFTGDWVVNIADSWRISGDISANFNSIAHIIDLSADLWMYSGPGRYNDMDMLQVGRGMSYEEDKAHFTMWCMMMSPLLAGNDLTTMSDETLSILTNEDVIALNQDPLFYQARRIYDLGELELWAKPLIHTMSGEVAVTLFNRSGSDATMNFTLEEVGLDCTKGYQIKDLWSKEEYAASNDDSRSFTVPSHGVVTLRIKGESLPFNIFQKK